MPVWPLSGKRPLLASYVEQAPTGNLIRTAMDIGPAKVRRRGSVGVRDVAVSFILNPFQVSEFTSWFESSIGGGAQSFSFVDVRTETTRLMRFKSDPPYTLTPISTNRWSLTMTWEILPQ